MADDRTEMPAAVGHLLARWRLLLAAPIVGGAIAVGASYLVTPMFTARTAFLPPQQGQSAASGALATLGSLTGLFGSVSGPRVPTDQYVSLLQSTTIADRLIERFELQKVYDKEWRDQVRRELARNTRVSAGKRDGIITVEVDDERPERAAQMARQYVDELRQLSQRLALTEAQQRRVFFEAQLQRTRDALAKAQAALQGSGFSQEALKAEPKAAAEGYARLKAEITTAEARLDALRRNLTDAAPEVQQASAAIAVLRGQLARLEGEATRRPTDDYVGRYREFKYQETLFEQFSRQYELARLDESREGLLQVIDEAQPPERKSWPKRSLFGVGGMAGGLVLAAAWVLLRQAVRRRDTAAPPTVAPTAPAGTP